MRVALSADGTSIFLESMSGARGVVIVDPRGPSAARVSLGAATFDTRIALAQSPMRFPQKPAPIGGILRASERARGLVTGGDAARLELTIIDDDDVFEWVAPHATSFDCATFASKPVTWPTEVVAEGTKTLVPKNERLPVRASPRGDIVARVRVQDAHVIKLDKGMTAIEAWTPLGVVAGWVDSAELVAPPTPTTGHIENHSSGGGGGGMGRMRPVKVTCTPGAPLLLLRDDKLYRVGRLHDATDPPITSDWRIESDGHVRLEITLSQPSSRYFVLEDDFRVTNSFWHHGVHGQFVVLGGEAGCVKDAPPPEHPR
jgi:hypothetical protein